jgi:hypothetical protein
MTTQSTSTKSNPFRRYALAAARCKRLSGDSLSAAQDKEAEAISALTTYPTSVPKDIAKKVSIAIGLLPEGPWLDGRDVAMLESVERDLKALSRRTA